jgi:hypothetical protein
MSRTVALHIVAWVAVPLAFAIYVNLVYSWSLARGSLPFLGTQELRWWVAFVLALLFGGTCIAISQRRDGIMRLLWPLIYVVAMTAVLASVHLAVACSRGDCL